MGCISSRVGDRLQLHLETKLAELGNQALGLRFKRAAVEVISTKIMVGVPFFSMS